MERLLEDTYFKLREKEIDKGKILLKRITLDTMLRCVTRNCWQNSIQYEIIIKMRNYFVIRLFGLSETVLLKYQVDQMAFLFDVDTFLSGVQESEANKGIYIIAGEFHHRVYEHYGKLNKKNDFLIVDGIHFIKDQIGFAGNAVEGLNTKKIGFYKYFPD